LDPGLYVAEAEHTLRVDLVGVALQVDGAADLDGGGGGGVGAGHCGRLELVVLVGEFLRDALGHAEVCIRGGLGHDVQLSLSERQDVRAGRVDGFLDAAGVINECEHAVHAHEFGLLAVLHDLG